MPAPLDRPPHSDPGAPNIALLQRALERARHADDDIPALAKGELRMLFAAGSFTRGVHALQRAYELAARSRGVLYVLHVTPPERAGTQDAANQLGIARAALRSMQRFGERGPLDALLPRDRILVRHGDFADVVTQTARELDAELVVLAGAERRKGACVARIARRAEVPVLVARKPSRGGPILAATDLSDPGCGELRQAARLAQRLHGPLAFLHNVTPFVHASSTALGHCMCTVIEPSAHALAQCRDRLQGLASYLGVRADALVLTRPSAEQAILETARTSGADLVVVGARPKSWLRRLLGSALAARIVDRCERSVLVAPISQGELRAAMPTA